MCKRRPVIALINAFTGKTCPDFIIGKSGRVSRNLIGMDRIPWIIYRDLILLERAKFPVHSLFGTLSGDHSHCKYVIALN